ncbi:type II toxin-antitoxin system HicA family toxin [Methylosinus sp. KRF6]|nr:type II toxin-antitoxin system HicA family toxin [Methylosinus sp. KRF6]
MPEGSPWVRARGSGAVNSTPRRIRGPCVYLHKEGEGYVVGRAGRSNKRNDIEARLHADGWRISRKGPGDHVQYTHPDRPGRVTIDAGAKEFPTGTLRSIYKQAGWPW